jgi:hypothetical protein
MATATCSLGTFDSFFFTLLMIVILSLSLYHSLPYSIDLRGHVPIGTFTTLI